RDARVPDAAWIEAPPGPARTPDLEALANVRSSPYRAFVRDTALRRIPRRSMRRNALLALGNRAGPLDAAERRAVDQAEADDDPQIRAAAQRARQRREGG
ncbi:MAG: hypothetical protein KDK70_32680, partial [Myxococcales bacterium]|nr:hypothetical protein [Myxococcales bacterium]